MAFDRDRGNRGGGGRSFGSRDFGGSKSFDRPRTMTKVTCSECGKETEVPFKPSGERPVYCRECFAKMGGPEERRSFNRNDSRPSFKKFEDRPQAPSNNNSQLNEINAKLDQLIKLLSPKSEEKPIEQKAEKKIIEKPAKNVKIIAKAKKAVKKIVETPIEAAEEV